MSWLRNSQLRNSINTKRWSYSPPKDCDPVACTESFKKHWQQASEIIERTQPPGGYPVHDDVLGVVNHVSQMVTLLVLELRNGEPSPAACLEHLLSESILQSLFEWSVHTGRYCHMVKLEQLKLYELLVSQSGQNLLVHEPFLRPLLRLLASCCDEVLPLEVEKHLVQLLNQLCVSVMQNPQFLDLFFSNSTSDSSPSFILFTLLIPFIYRSGAIGQQARDALLLCMSMSKQHDPLGAFIADHSNVCPVLATGLSGIYSTLPRKFEVEAEDWHRLTPDDVNELPDLTLFINSLEFCNAVIEVAHTSVKEQLIEFIYQGFLVPVMGTALLQSTGEELVAATAYYDLFLRSSTSPGLLPTLIGFLMKDCYDSKRILTTLIYRINSTSSKLCLVTLALLETLISFDSEEVMSELILKYLTPCTHVMLSQRARLRDADCFSSSALRLLSLTPSVCLIPINAANVPSNPAVNPVYGLHPEESLYGNYHAYLCHARARIHACAKACRTWRFPYDGETPPASEDDLTISLGGDSSGYESLCVKGSPGNENTNGLEPSVSSPLKNGLPDQRETKESEGTSEKDGGVARRKELARRLSPPEHRTARSTSLEPAPGTPDIGPFLDCVLHMVEKMPSLSLQVNLRLTGIISRLAVYPQPLLSSLLLNHSLVFQPSIRSLFQTLRSLKHSLDKALARTPGVEDLIVQARSYMLNREERLASIRRTAVEAPVSRRPSSDPFSRGDSKRRSFSSALSSFVRKALPSTEQLVENELPGTGYRYVRSRGGSGQDSESWNRVLCVILFDEWLKELAAIAQEHSLFAVSALE